MIWHNEEFFTSSTHKKDVLICICIFILFTILRIPADIKDAAFCTGIKYGDTEDSAKMLALYKSTKTYSEKASALDALACTEHRPLLKT